MAQKTTGTTKKPTSPKKNTGTQGTTKKSTTTKSSATATNPSTNSTVSYSRLTPLILMAVGIMLLLMAIVPGDNYELWKILHQLMLGTFSWCAYIIGPLTIYTAVILERDKGQTRLMSLLLCIAVLILLLCGLTQSIFGSFPKDAKISEIFSHLLEKGKLIKGGGAASIVIGVPLIHYLGKFGATVLMLVILLVAVMFLTNTSIHDLIIMLKRSRGIISKFKRKKVSLAQLEANINAAEESAEDENTQLLREIYAYKPKQPSQPELEEAVPPPQPVPQHTATHRTGLRGAYDIITGRAVAVDKTDIAQAAAKPHKMYDIDSDTPITAPEKPKKRTSKSRIDIPTHTAPEPIIKGVLAPPKSLGEFAHTIDDTKGKAPVPLSELEEKSTQASPEHKSIDFLISKAVSGDIEIPAAPTIQSSNGMINFGNPEDNITTGAELSTEKSSALAEENPQADVLSDSAHGSEAKEQSYIFPPTDLLNEPQTLPQGDTTKELRANAERLVNTLRSFGVETRIIDISRGPAVTRYELQPSVGVKISKITNLADDIALNLAAGEVRLEAPIPNKAAVGIEVPNKVISAVPIRELLENREFIGAPSKLTVALGKDITGNICLADLSKMPHILIAGATGSGKSVCVNSLIISILYKATPDEVKLIMIDPKVVELGNYNGIPHLLSPVVNDPKKAAGALCTMVAEMLRRYKLFADHGVRDLAGYNKLARNSDELSALPQIVIIIDELADLMMAAPKDVEDSICRLAQMARAAGMYLVIATQRPSVDVITGIIKANIPSRISFAVSSQVDSRTILDSAGAEKLLGKGDMLFSPVGSSKPVRVQGCFVTDSEVEAVVSFVKQNSTACYDESFISKMESSADELAQKGQKGSAKKQDIDTDEEDDALIDEAISIVIESGQSSTSYLQRRLKIGYARAARIIDQMERRGVLGPYEGSKPRQVLVSRSYNSQSIDS